MLTQQCGCSGEPRPRRRACLTMRPRCLTHESTWTEPLGSGLGWPQTAGRPGRQSGPGTKRSGTVVSCLSGRDMASLTDLVPPFKLFLDTEDGTGQSQHGSDKKRIIPHKHLSLSTACIHLGREEVSGRHGYKTRSWAYRNDDVLLEALLEHLELVGPRRHGDCRWGFLIGRGVSGLGVGISQAIVAVG